MYGKDCLWKIQKTIEIKHGIRRLAVEIICESLKPILKSDELKKYTDVYRNKIGSGYNRAYAKYKLDKHFSAINWIKEHYNSIWFQVLDFHLTVRDAEHIIQRRMNG